MKLRPNFILCVRIGRVDLAFGLLGRLVSVRPRAHRLLSALANSAVIAGLVGAVCVALCPPVLDQAAVADLEPLLARLRHRPCGSLGVKAPLCLLEPCPPSFAAGDVIGKLIATRFAVALVFGSVDLGCLGERLLGDLLVGADR
jgi:hypothetical protein